MTLDGEVEWQYQKDAAINVVMYLSGVIGVTNLITFFKLILNSYRNLGTSEHRSFASVACKRKLISAKSVAIGSIVACIQAVD